MREPSYLLAKVDDLAALGDWQGLEKLACRLQFWGDHFRGPKRLRDCANLLGWGVMLRRQAVRARLEGRIRDAVAFEAASERDFLKAARKYGRARARGEVRS